MKRFQKLLALLLTFVFILSAVACGTEPVETTPQDDPPVLPPVDTSVDSVLGGEENALFIGFRPEDAEGELVNGAVLEAEGTFYLPSYADLTSLKIELDNVSYGASSGSLQAANKGETIDLTPFASTDARGFACYKVVIRAFDKEETYTFYVGGSIPAVFITTSEELSWIEKKKDNRDKGASAVLCDKNGVVIYEDAADAYSEIKVRGNGSMNLAKKSYQLKLSTKTSILHMEAAKNWILLPNYDDQSLLRNAVVYTYADKLGFETMEFQSVDLYINGEYRGVYLLTEKVEIQADRVDITELEKEVELANPNVNFDRLYATNNSKITGKYLTSYKYYSTLKDPADITGGYLVELDNNYGKDEPSVFYTKDGSTWVVKSPEYTSKAQMEYISGLFADMVEAMNAPDGYNAAGKHYTEYIDVDSFALGYLISEISKNWDAGSSSHYFYKEKDVNGVTGKIVMGPLWDCDNTLGNCNKVDDAAKIDELKTASRSIFKMLMQHADFKALVAEKFGQAKEIALAMAAPGGDIDQLVDELGGSAAMDQTRWKTYDKAQWPLYGEALGSVHYDTWSNVPGGMFTFRAVYSDGTDLTSDTTIGYMKDWFVRRVNALEPLLGN